MGTWRAKVLSASHADPVYSGSFMTENSAGTRVLHKIACLRSALCVRQRGSISWRDALSVDNGPVQQFSEVCGVQVDYNCTTPAGFH
jgi:hypothetical protein